jgi:hypothetical protein
MNRLVVPCLAFSLLAALVAGCGAHSAKPYTAAGTRPCLTQKGFKHVTTDPVKVGFIAGFAENGGVQGRAKDGNVLTIAFAADASSVASTELAFKNHAPPKLRPRINDIMESQGNAVLVWTISPTPKQLADAESCLHP